jgi:hypothetical protein
VTYIGVETNQFQVEDRSWDLSPHGSEPGTTPSITLDVSAFTEGTHYPNGYVPSGMPLGKITATGLYGPYDNTAVDGREDCAGLLFASTRIPSGATTVGGALKVHGFVDAAKLPVELDAAGQADLTLIHFA